MLSWRHRPVSRGARARATHQRFTLIALRVSEKVPSGLAGVLLPLAVCCCSSLPPFFFFPSFSVRNESRSCPTCSSPDRRWVERVQIPTALQVEPFQSSRYSGGKKGKCPTGTALVKTPARRIIGRPGCSPCECGCARAGSPPAARPSPRHASVRTRPQRPLKNPSECVVSRLSKVETVRLPNQLFFAPRRLRIDADCIQDGPRHSNRAFWFFSPGGQVHSSDSITRMLNLNLNSISPWGCYL